MEIDKESTYRLIAILVHKIKTNWLFYIKWILSNIFVIIGYTHIIWFYYTHMIDCSYPIGALFILSIVLLEYVCYCIINHLIISKYLKHYTLFLIEILLIATLFIILK